ncbi:unnamed protein product [Prunus brigantina]
MILLGCIIHMYPKLIGRILTMSLIIFNVNIQGWNESEHIEERRIIKYKPT